MSSLRILVTGSRDWTDRATIRRALVKALDQNWTGGRAVLVHGGARGADTIAEEEWRILRDLGPIRTDGPAEPPGWWLAGLDIEAHPARWGDYGKRAGMVRNAEMVRAGVTVCLAFPLGESRGTRGCMALAEKAGIPVICYEGREAPAS